MNPMVIALFKSIQILKMSIIKTSPSSVVALPVSPLPDVMLEPLVRMALLEDLGRAGDLTTDTIVPADARDELRLVARQEGVLAGVDLARLAFSLMDGQLQFQLSCADGTLLKPGMEIARISGKSRAILTAERTALNYLCHLSGVASATHSIAEAIKPFGTRVTCTRKTMPGLRSLQKYAVRVGGGSNHRFGLDDAVLIKDNHIALAGDVATAVGRARAGVGHMVKIELEVDTLAQLEVALSLGVDVVLLDNMSLDDLRTAVGMCKGRAITEASGRITPETAPAVAATGVDQIAVGWLTHSARVLDIGLDV